MVARRLEAALDRVREEEGFVDLKWFSVTSGPKGSYRKEHILEYLKKHLPLMTPGRQWRILMCDVFSAQVDEEVVAAAADRGYVLAWHGGGCTGVLQRNDTHLHQHVSARYQEIEMADLSRQSELRPDVCPRRDREDCIRDAIACWKCPDLHARVARGHLDNMLTVALDGSEDHMGRGDAARFWAECGMTSKRASALADVNARWSDGSISWERHRELIQELPRRGQLDVYAEGQEDEGTHSGPQAWSDREDPSEDEDDSNVIAFAKAGPPSVGPSAFAVGRRGRANEAGG